MGILTRLLDFYIYVTLKDRKRSMSEKKTTERSGITETATTRTFALLLFLNNHNALLHVKICHNAKFVSWLLKEMTTTNSDFKKIT
jgi:hypothetical protein